MEFRGIRQTSHIGGVNRNPELLEHNKAMVWDNDLKKIKWLPFPTALGPNTKTANGYVYKGDDSPGAEYVWKLDSNKNPFWRKEEYLKTITKQVSGNYGVFTMNSGDVKYLQLGALAWLDDVDLSITLPGDTKILFDDNNTVGGDSSFTFNKTNKTLNLTDFAGIQVKNNLDSSLQSAFQYFGGNNILLAHGVLRSILWATNLTNNICIGETSGGGFSTAQNNLLLGHYSGSNTSNNITGSVFIGNYSGRLETANNKFYVGNTNYATLSEYRSKSLLYGDFSTGWLKVNDRLEVGQEVKIGSFNGANTPSWGMLQFIETAAPGIYKPQYHDGSIWQDFASGANYYLQAVTKGTADVGTTDVAYRITFDMNGIPDHTLQLGANAFNSDIIPEASPDLLAGYIQLSSGDNSDSNRGFTHSTDLSFILNRLSINGDINLGVTSLTGGSAGLVKFDGNHFYGYAKDDDNIDYEWRRLDVDPSSIGENNTASNIGLSGIGLFYQKYGVDLQFKTIERVDDRIVLTDNGTNFSVDLSLSLTPTAQNITPVTVKTYSGSVLGSLADAETENPKLYLKKLISNTVQITENANEVILEVTGAGGGEANTASNLGTGVAVYKEKVGADLRFKTITNGSHNTATANPNGLELYIEVDDLTLTNSGVGEAFVSLDANTFDILQKTFIDGLATEVVATTDDITVNVTKEIPKFTFTTTPVFTAGITPGQGLISFKSDYSADIRSSATLAATTMFSFNIGTGLFYNSLTNTLESLSSAGATTDYRLTSADTNYVEGANKITLHITDEFGGGAESTIEVNLPVSTDPLVATYTDNISPAFGGIIVNKSNITTGLGTYQSFILDELTGEFSFGLDPVLYSQQYDLHDGIDETKRTFARSNVEAAYINGDIIEDFSANKLEAIKINVDTVSTDEFASDTSKIQGVKFKGPHVTSSSENSGVYLSKRQLSTDTPSSIEVRIGSVNIQANNEKGSGEINFYSVTNSGVQTRIAYIDATGDLHVKGDIIAFDTTV